MGRIFSFTAVAAVIWWSGLHAEEAPRSSAAVECRFERDPAAYLERAARIRSDVDARTRQVRAVRVHTAIATVAPDSLPRRNFVDEQIFGKLSARGVMSAPLSGDEEFLRRVYLDLTGALPPPETVRTFLADTSDGKRDAVIDRLLGSPQFIDKWTMWLGDLLGNTPTLVNAAVNRNAEGRNAFHAYIRNAVTQDKPLSTMAAEVVAGKGNNYEAESGSANFPLGASTAMGPLQDTYDAMLTRTATTFLGLSHFDCLLCHDGRGHLTQVSAWGARQTRMQAYEMAAFFSRMTFTPGPARGSFLVGDASDGGYDLNTNSGNRPDRTPIGTIRRVLPAYRGADGPALTEGDWRAALGSALVRDPMFARNLANRIWKQMFGLALVDPVDSLDPARLDPANPPAAPWELQATHPELLEQLAAELPRRDFKLRAFIKLLVQSSAWQLSSRYDGEWTSDYVPLFARHFARRMEAEEVHDAITTALGTPVEYTVAASSERAKSAMQLPDTIEPASDAGVRNFLNAFLRGDRDTQDRSQAGSIQQQLMLMNDPFVTDRAKLGRSPRLAALERASNAELAEELYLAFLSRRPTESERAAVLARLAQPGSRGEAVEDLAWMCINRAEFLFSY